MLRPRSRTEVAGCLDVLAERSLLGSQMRPPTVHVRLISDASGHRRSHSHTRTGSGSAAGSRTRARSHTHSNSLGTSTSNGRSDESSFMWDPTHSHNRSHSLGKSALKIVRSTAATAASLCGFSPVDKERVAADNDKGVLASDPIIPPGIESAARIDATRHPRLQMQTQMLGSERRNEGEGLVVITPQSPSAALAFALRSRGGISTLLPTGKTSPSTPSGLVSPADGVGIALSTPPSSAEDHSWQRHVPEQIRIPPHPYAQGSNTHVYQPPPSGAETANLPEGHVNGETRDDTMNRHRQPVLVHPYSPYTRSPHPYAVQASAPPQATAAASGETSPLSQTTQYVDVQSNMSMFAELSPGHVREFQSDDIQDSPVDPPAHASSPHLDELVGRAVGHPFGPSSNRMSEWGFADALTHTLRRQGSTDSGLGTSEDHTVAQDATGPRSSPAVLQDRPLTQSPEQENPSMARQVPTGPRVRPSPNHVLAQTPSLPFIRSSTSFDRPTPWRSLSNIRHNNSSRSSPGLISHESSPPLSPRLINTAEDLERFRNLFYQPPEKADGSIEDLPGGSLPSRRPSESLSLDISSASARSASGLTTLARQLAEDLEELRENALRYGERTSLESERESATSPMWGRRYGGLRGQRPDDFVLDPNMVLTRTSSDSDSPPDMTTSPLRIPLDRSLTLSQPTINVPEDIEMSPRTSSDIDLPIPEDSKCGCIFSFCVY